MTCAVEKSTVTGGDCAKKNCFCLAQFGELHLMKPGVISCSACMVPGHG